jgi:uncharacterized protein (DUF4415 family)
MSDTPTIKRVRGKGKHPAKAHVNIRLPQEVLEFYKGFPSYTRKMRDVLTDYAKEHATEVVLTPQVDPRQISLPLE